jgi:hypothetical protein
MRPPVWPQNLVIMGWRSPGLHPMPEPVQGAADGTRDGSERGFVRHFLRQEDYATGLDFP